MTERRQRPGPWRALLDLAWRQPLWAIPFALFFGTLYGGGTWGGYVEALRISLVFSIAIGLALWVVAQFVAPRLERDPSGHPGGRMRVGFAYVAGAMLGSWIGAVATHFTVMPGFLGTGRAILISGMFSVLFVTLFSGISFAIVFYRQAVDRARAVEAAKRQLAEAELRALRAQIHPHFLFNTLNSIASLIATDPAAAEDVTTRLAELFRHTLQASERGTSTLAEELGFVRNYLEIERARFGDRLRVREQVADGVLELPIPSLILQPLVENAVHHAVSVSERGAAITLAARRDGARLVLEVEDDGPGLDPLAPPRGAGFGLRSVRERLRALGPACELTVETLAAGGTRVRLAVPVTPVPRPSHEGGWS